MISTKFLFVAALVSVGVTARAQAPQAGTPDAEPTPMSAATPAAVPASPMLAGTGNAKFNALLQFWGVEDGTNAFTNYRLRRMELKFTGSVAPETRWFAMIDPAKSLSTGPASTTSNNAVTDKIIEDLGVAFSLTPELEIVGGQFKPPQTAESLDSSAELPLPERSLMSRQYSNRREPGLMLTYKTKPFKLAVASTNGQGPNADDIKTENEKDLHARLDLMLVDGIDFGAWTTAGNSGYQAKGRWGANARANFGSLIVRLEGLRAVDNTVYTTGFVADLGYKASDYFTPFLRFDGLEGTTTSTAATLGLNYFVSKHNAKIQAAYSQLRNMTGGNGTYTASTGKEGGLFVLALQAGI